MKVEGSFTLEGSIHTPETVIAIDEFRADWLDDDERAIAARLRALRWTGAPAVVRERCWLGIWERIARMDAEDGRGPGRAESKP